MLVFFLNPDLLTQAPFGESSGVAERDADKSMIGGSLTKATKSGSL